MASRTGPVDALERLAWVLNVHHGETVSINQLAAESNLSWATARKYSSLLERLGTIAPSISVSDKGVSVESVGPAIMSMGPQRDRLALLYLLTAAEAHGGLSEPVDRSDHEAVLSSFVEELASLETHGLIERTDETISLTPAGVSVVAPMRSKLVANGPSQPSTATYANHLLNPRQIDDGDWDGWGTEEDDSEWVRQRAPATVGW